MSSLIDNDGSELNYRVMKMENEKLHEQNIKLIKKLELLSQEFSKSQNKVKERELKNTNFGLNGNFNSFLEKQKILQEDNKRLCEELKYQIDWNKNNEAISPKIEMKNKCAQTDFIESQRIISDDKMINLKNRIQELQKQLHKTQQLTYKNECNYKISQIETLEALKACKLENDSLKEKISDLEIKAQKVLNLHAENFELKTLLNRTQNDLKLNKLNVEETKRKLEESAKILENVKTSYENQFLTNQKKFNDLSNENQVLISTIEEISKSVNKTKLTECENCEQFASLKIESEEKIKILESDLGQLKEDKLKIENDYFLQINIIKKFEEEQCQLREEVNQLNRTKFSFDSTLKSKLNEIDNLNFQLESSTQRLEVREQRINELTNQLALKSNEEHNLNMRITKLSEKFCDIENEVSKYQKALYQSTEENKLLMKNAKALESELKEKSLLISQVTLNLNETMATNMELENSLQILKSSFDNKAKEHSINIENFKKNIEELNHSINMYEKQCESLAMELKDGKVEYESIKAAEKRATEMLQKEKIRFEMEFEKICNINETLKSQIVEQNFKIKESEHRTNELMKKNSDKDKEAESLTRSFNNCNSELEEVKKQLSFYLEESKTYQLNKEIIENLKSECNVKTKKLQKSKKNTTELTEKIENLNKVIVTERQKLELLQSTLTNSENCVEKLKVKLCCTQEDLDHKKRDLDFLLGKKELDESQLLEKLRSVEYERDESMKKLRLNEEASIRSENEVKRLKEDIENLKKEIQSLREHVTIIEKLNAKLKNNISVLHEHLKASQMNVVDRSREIDRLEQLVRDRSEQIELRSNQLQIFEKELENGLKESQDQLEDMKRQNCLHLTDIEDLREKNKELSNLFVSMNEKNNQLLEMVKFNEKERNSLTEKILKMDNENTMLNKQLSNLKDEFMSKTTLVKELLEKINTKEKEIEKLTDEVESKTASLKAKAWQIHQIEDRSKKDKNNFTEIEAKLRAEIKIIQKKLDLFNSDKKKEIESTVKQLTNNFKNQNEELKFSKKNLESLKSNLDEMVIKMQEKEEQIADLKGLISTQSAVMIDMESNCRLKEVVIEKLLQRINNLTLTNLSDEIKDFQNESDLMTKEIKILTQNNMINLENKYEDISMQDLLKRINIRLNNDNQMDNNFTK